MPWGDSRKLAGDQLQAPVGSSLAWLWAGDDTAGVISWSYGYTYASVDDGARSQLVRGPFQVMWRNNYVSSGGLTGPGLLGVLG
jgi:hypothetical protein